MNPEKNRQIAGVCNALRTVDVQVETFFGH
jgi:hypothetical protein